ncbi:MAG: hypothetical protein ACLFV8_00600 [Alphaproteobacteria bacterium]
MTQQDPEQQCLVRALLEEHGRLYSDELGIDLSKNTPSVLFRWLCASLLLSARISSELAMKAARALSDAGWTTAQKMAGSTWEERVKVLNRSGYARYDESTSRMLGDTVAHMIDRYDGDLRRLREEAGQSPGRERKLLKEFKGVGDVGADIFFRETQTAWEELYPFADKKALSAAGRLDLPGSADGLAALAGKKDFARLVAALVRTSLSRDYEDVRRRASEGV